MNRNPDMTTISRRIWESKYRFHPVDGEPERDVQATWRRVARAIAATETVSEDWIERFYGLLDDFRFLPGGRILAGAGTDRRVTLFNCFVMGHIEDSMDGIFEALKQGALTMQQGGGVGYDFSTLRPAGTPAKASGSIASGPLSFMQVWDTMCATLLSTGSRRGAMMATLRCDHPDIEQFIEAKRDPARLRHFNLSVQVTDAFMRAIADDADWPLVFPAQELPPGEGECLERRWSGIARPIPCRVLRRVSARVLWERLMRASYDCAEPGVLFVDRINTENNLAYRERITATNPCGEIPLPPYGACDLGSLNLTRFLSAPFQENAGLDFGALATSAALAVRFLDDVIDASRFPLPQQAAEARATRRIGLGITGLGDALAMLGLHYDSDAARTLASHVMETVCHAAYSASIDLAQEKGAFPAFEAAPYLETPFITRLPAAIREGIRRHGIRNSHLLAIAPTGTISLLADNVSSGLEPIFDLSYSRRLHTGEGEICELDVEDHAYRTWRERNGGAPLPEAFVDAMSLSPRAHLAMQAALQPFVDNAISKTINCPADIPFDDFRAVYETAHALGLKGCTTFRPNPTTGAVLERQRERSHCCGIDREAD